LRFPPLPSCRIYAALPFLARQSVAHETGSRSCLLHTTKLRNAQILGGRSHALFKAGGTAFASSM
jgi:hypothetical protein